MEASTSRMNLSWSQYCCPSCANGEARGHSLICCRTQTYSTSNFFVGDGLLPDQTGNNPIQQHPTSNSLPLPRQANPYQPDTDPQGTLSQENFNIPQNYSYFWPSSNARVAHFSASTRAVAFQSPENLTGIPSSFGQMSISPTAPSYQDLDWESYFQAHLPPSLPLQRLACHIVRQPWFRSSKEEPPLDENEEVVKEGHLPSGGSHSRFDLFFDPNGRRRCRWIEHNKRCPHEAGRLDRARGHAYTHFNYKLFACQGMCGKADCQGRYTRSALLNDHLNRASRPRKICHICQRSVTAQNFRRHTKMHF